MRINYLLKYGMLIYWLTVMGTTNMVYAQSQDITQALTNLAKTEAASRMIMGTSVVFNLTPKFDDKDPRIVVSKPQEVINSLLSGEPELAQERWILGDKESMYEYRVFLPSGITHQSVMGSFDGHTERWYLSNEPSADPASINPLWVGFIDEKNHSSWNPQFTSPWGGNFGGSAPFSDILKNGNPRLVGTPVVNGLKTLQIEATQQTGEQLIHHTAWLAPERSYREIRKDIEIPIPGPDNLKRHVRYETSNFIQFGGQWIPQAGREIDWLENNQGPYRWSLLAWWKIIEVKPMETDLRSIFSFSFPLGTVVNDHVNNDDYVEGGDIRPDIELLQTMLKDRKLPDEIDAFVRKTVSRTPDISTAIAPNAGAKPDK